MSRQPNGGFIGKENITDNTNASGVYTLSDVTQKVADNEFPTARYTPSRSLRFRRSGAAYLSKTYSTAPTSRTTITHSFWIKLGEVTGPPNIWALFGTVDNWEQISITSPSNGNGWVPNTIRITGPGSAAEIRTTQVFRDPSAWYHIVVVYDTTNAISSERIRLFVNGSRVTSFVSASYPPQNQTTTQWLVSNNQSNIGITGGSTSQTFDGYMAEINVIDGQALTPASFGEYEERTGEWKAKRYAGTYGTNGFYLSFANNSSTSALGLDDGTGLAGSGAGSNDWTTNNFSLAAGADYDSMVDVPGVGSSVINDTGGVTRGNYATLNPAIRQFNVVDFTSEGNLRYQVGANGGATDSAFATIPMTSGKWYAEVLILSTATGQWIGVCSNVAAAGLGLFGGGVRNPGFAYRVSSGNKCNNDNVGVAYGASSTVNDIIGIAMDADIGSITFFKNGVSLGVAFTGMTNVDGGGWLFGVDSDPNGSFNINFGQQPFAYSPPTGFKTLCTTNLPEPNIKRPVDHFDVKLWTGNGAGQTIGNTARERDNYEISRSLRFNPNDSNHLIRTPAVAGNRKTWTWSGWVKRGNINANGTLFAARTGVGATYLTMVLSSLSDFRMESNSETSYPLYKTNALFSDPAAWYHFVVALDMTQATSTHRLKVYVNGVLQTTASFNVPAQNTDLAVNSTETHLIGQQASGNYFDGYLTEINFVDGQALEPESFGQFDVDGSWQAKRYTGTYGTNGFYLQFNQEELQNVSADFLVVAGGGGGFIAGGGAGGYRTSAGTSGGGASAESAFSLSTNNARYRITVGAGGAGHIWPNAQNEATQRGSVSVFGIITSNGGGGGGGSSDNGFSGGSGGGSGISGAGAAGIAGQGFTGGSGTGGSYTPAGGGGAGAAGGNFTGGQSGGTPGSGGSGVASSITGSSVTRAGGGGGSTSGYFGQGPAGAGGAGGGGGGGSGGGAGTVGTANTGGGGGGGSLTNAGNAIGAGANGGSGIIIVKIPNTHTATFSAGVTSSLSTSVTGFNIYTVTATSTTSETVAFNPV